jgi:hypothetical protein
VAEHGLPALRLSWENASWHTSQAVGAWIRLSKQPVQTRQRGVRMVAYWWPVKRPGLNPLEPNWVHGQRAVSEPDRLLSAAERDTCVCTD